MSVSLPSNSTRLPDVKCEAVSDQRLAPNMRERFMGFAFSMILRTLSASWRVQIIGAQQLEVLALAKRRHILAFWHRHYITLFNLMRNHRVVVVTNRSHRGMVIADICHRNRIETLQIGDHGSKSMLAAIDRATTDGLGLGIAVDGPLGPANVVKPVVPHLAMRLDCPIIPIAVSAQRKCVFTNRWDRLQIPCFFSRVSFVVGEPIELPQFGKCSTRNHAHRIEDAIHELS